jgi:hypothetical protein
MPSKEICHLVLNDKVQKIVFGGEGVELMKVSAEEIAKYKKSELLRKQLLTC